ncbi:7 transmembrane sweet-taste receptor of 3 GCPR-domain containing protein [Nitzschia inconspicua]|uniref:7 transmembrane sweet-taste receptor of 3 GCPR-domain containing protein n=1 Tax=Nitzschia inconspicua TaxID=303405 RepID=A0A9K3LH32_9STRA|nr:7 transmembrane sweet-taste receptor of 3 GCPR-domain containing protein [Nitzschia inconspicua]
MWTRRSSLALHMWLILAIFSRLHSMVTALPARIAKELQTEAANNNNNNNNNNQDSKDDRQLTFGMVSGDSEFFNPVRDGWLAECAVYDVNCIYLPVNYTYFFEHQEDKYSHPCIPLMLQLVEMGVDGISAACHFEDVAHWRAAYEAGIPLVAFDTRPPEGFPIPLEAYVGTDQEFLGRTQARLLKQLRPEGGTFGIIQTPAFKERVEAFREEIFQNNAREDRANWYEADMPIESYDTPNDIDQHPWFMELLAEANVTAMIFMYQTPMRAENYTQFIDKHRHRNITYIGTDGSNYQLEYLSRRYVDGLVGQLPYDMGSFSVDVLYKAALDKKKNKDVREQQHTREILLDAPELPLVRTNLVAYNLIPIELPELKVDQSLLGLLVIAGYVCFGITALFCLVCSIWTVWNRNGMVVKASQPSFLLLTVFGVFLIACALIPLSFDDDGNAEEMEQSFRVGICMSIPWLVFVGFTCTFSALFSKTWRVNKFFHTKSQFGRLKISEFDVLLPFFVLLSLNFIVLICWTVIDPLTYERKFLPGTDYWNRELASVGRCQSEHPTAYLVPLACVNFLSLVIAAWQAWQARDIQDEFSEGKYIGLSIFSMCQAFLTGIPIIAVVKDIPEAFYLVTVFLLFMLCIVVLSLVFMPKILIQYKYSKLPRTEQRQMLAVNVRKSAFNNSKELYDSSEYSSRKISGLGMPTGGGSGHCHMYRSSELGSHASTDGAREPDAINAADKSRREIGLHVMPPITDGSSNASLIFTERGCGYGSTTATACIPEEGLIDTDNLSREASVEDGRGDKEEIENPDKTN